ncbi:MAG: TolC family protein [Candidatus Sericytochromatia bacterium]|nr:TolC family protein [Candidatus Sericytochromatia bacterium]
MTSHKPPLSWLLVAWLTLQAPAQAQARPAAPLAEVSLEDAVARARLHNPTIQAARIRVTQARLEAEAQRWWWARALRTQLNVGLPGTPNVALTPEGTVLPTAAVGVLLNLGDVATAPAATARADQAVLLAEADYRRTVLEVSNQITQAHAEYQAARRAAGWARLAITAAEADVRVAERQFERGQVASNTLLAARLAHARAQAEAETQAGQATRAWSTLVTLVADPTLAVVPPRTAARR